MTTQTVVSTYHDSYSDMRIPIWEFRFWSPKDICICTDSLLSRYIVTCNSCFVWAACATPAPGSMSSWATTSCPPSSPTASSTRSSTPSPPVSSESPWPPASALAVAAAGRRTATPASPRPRPPPMPTAPVKWGTASRPVDRGGCLLSLGEYQLSQYFLLCEKTDFYLFVFWKNL